MVLSSWTSGWRRVWQGRAMAIGVHLVILALTVPLAAVLREQIVAQLDRSLVAQAVADGVSYDWWTEFSDRASGLAATFTPSIVGFASTLDSLSRVLDARYPPPVLLWFLGGAFVVWTFLSGGIIDRYARQRPTYAHGFFSACGRLFFPLARLVVAVGLAYWVLFHYLHPWLFVDVYRDLTRGLGVERTTLLWRLLFYLLFGALLLAVGVVFDYARIRLVVEGRRSALGALAAAVRFLWRQQAPATALYLTNGLGFLLLLGLWAPIAPGIHTSGLAAVLAFALAQLYLLLRLAIKLQFLASQTALFQARLAHATYTAAPIPAWPDSPAAEAIGQ